MTRKPWLSKAKSERKMFALFRFVCFYCYCSMKVFFGKTVPEQYPKSFGPKAITGELLTLIVMHLL